MAEKKIEVRVAAVGGDQAAAEVRKVADAAKGVQPAATNAADGFDDLRQTMEELRECAEALQKDHEELADGMDDTGESADGLNDKVGKISRAQQAQVMSQLAANVGKLGMELQAAADDAEKFDEKLAASLRNAGRGLETLANGISSVALGFAAGGPIGAAAASLVVAIQAIGQAWMESKVEAMEALQEQIAATREANKATEDAAQAAIERNNALASAQVAASIKAQNDAISDQADALKKVVDAERELRELRNEALNAKDKETLAQIDLDEARGTITGAEAKSRRREVADGAAERNDNERRTKAREDAVLAGKDAIAKTESASKAAAAAAKAEQARRDAEAEFNKKKTIAERAVANDESVFSGDADYQKNIELFTKIEQIGTGSQIAQARQKLEASKEKAIARIAAELAQAAEDLAGKSIDANTTAGAASKAGQDAAEARREADSKNTTADRTDATVEAVSGSRKRERELREQAEARRAFDAAKKKKEETDRTEAEREARDISRQGRGIPGQVEAGIAGARDVPLTREVAAAAAALKDGATSGEYAGLGEALNEFVNASQSISAARRQELTQLANTVKNLAERLRRVEGK